MCLIQGRSTFLSKGPYLLFKNFRGPKFSIMAALTDYKKQFEKSWFISNSNIDVILGISCYACYRLAQKILFCPFLLKYFATIANFSLLVAVINAKFKMKAEYHSTCKAMAFRRPRQSAQKYERVITCV